MKQYLIVATVALLIGAYAGYALHKPQTQTIEVEKEVLKRDVVTQIKVVTKPDGTKEELTLITDKSTENKESSKSTTIAKPDWHVSVSAINDKLSEQGAVYQLNAQRRIIGDVFIGGTVSTDKKVGVSIGISF